MSSSSCILAVDDNPRNLAIVKKSLAPEFEVVTELSGDAALEAASRLRPDLVLLDIMMPGCDGYETCRRLRSDPRLTGTKIILVSARASTAERIEGYAAGADDYLPKPFDPDELLAKVRVYLRLKRVEEIDQVKTDLLTLFGHEVRTPLTCIVGPLDLLAADTELAPLQRELVDMMIPAARRLSVMVDQISCLIDLKAGNAPLDRWPEALDAIVARAVMRAGDRAERAGVSLEQSDSGEGIVSVDERHLGRAIDEIITNAIRFSPPGGTVRLRTAATAAGARLEIADEGPGVPSALGAQLLQPFAVADLAHHQSGLGLGLATARTIVERHGGRLSLIHRNGPGAAFAIDLPFAEQPVASRLR